MLWLVIVLQCVVVSCSITVCCGVVFVVVKLPRTPEDNVRSVRAVCGRQMS